MNKDAHQQRLLTFHTNFPDIRRMCHLAHTDWSVDPFSLSFFFSLIILNLLMSLLLFVLCAFVLTLSSARDYPDDYLDEKVRMLRESGLRDEDIDRFLGRDPRMAGRPDYQDYLRDFPRARDSRKPEKSKPAPEEKKITKEEKKTPPPQKSPQVDERVASAKKDRDRSQRDRRYDSPYDYKARLMEKMRERDMDMDEEMYERFFDMDRYGYDRRPDFRDRARR